ncbi:peroxiredoxin [Leucobacter sp. BZR 635]
MPEYPLVPGTRLPSTAGGTVDLSSELGMSVVFVYPRTSPPGGPSMAWQALPGARGCTAESCGFRDLAHDFARLGARIFGVSTQDPQYQLEASTRLHLSYPLLSDARLELAGPLRLETFGFEGLQLYRRATLLVENGTLVHRFGEIPDPAAHPQDVLTWLERNAPRKS